VVPGLVPDRLDLGAHRPLAAAGNPANGEAIPIWIADYVLMEYGTGAIMAVPAHDERDYEFATRHGLDIRDVIRPSAEDAERPYTGWDGTMINSGEFNGATCRAAVRDVTAWLEDKDVLLVTSQKESFSYAAAEAAAKGLKPVVHNFWRVRDIWPEEWVWDTVGQAAAMIDSGFCHSQKYRDYVEEHYSLERMMQGLNRACGLR